MYVYIYILKTWGGQEGIVFFGFKDMFLKFYIGVSCYGVYGELNGSLA
jgi:hypothetical protein